MDSPLVKLEKAIFGGYGISPDYPFGEDDYPVFRHPTNRKWFAIVLTDAPGGYFGRKEKLSYWRTYTGIEVDAVIGDARIAIEIKSANEVKPKHRKGLQEFAKDYPGARLILVSLDRLSRRSGDVECLYVMDFLRMMWSGGLAASL